MNLIPHVVEADYIKDYLMSAKTSMTQKCQDIDYLKGQFVPRHR